MWWSHSPCYVMTMPTVCSFLSKGSATPTEIIALTPNEALSVSILSLERAASGVLFKDSHTSFTNPFLVAKLNWGSFGIYQGTYEGPTGSLHDRWNPALLYLNFFILSFRPNSFWLFSVIWDRPAQCLVGRMADCPRNHSGWKHNLITLA